MVTTTLTAALVLVLAGTATSFVLAATGVDPCALQREAAEAKPVGPEQLLPMRKLSEPDANDLMDRRACLKSYAHQFAEELDAFRNAPSADLRANLQVLRTYFDGKPSPTSMQDYMRVRYIAKGWEREQALLWGSVFLIRTAYREGDLDAVLADAAAVRSEFGLRAAKLTSWDKVQGATYFSKQALKNMIIAVEYMARVRKPGTSSAEAKKAREAYLADREALQPFAKFVGNPDAVMFQATCKGH